MKDWNFELEQLGCKYTYEEIMQMLNTFINSLSPAELELFKVDIDTLFAKHQTE